MQEKQENKQHQTHAAGQVGAASRRYFGDPLEVQPFHGVYFDLEAGIALELITHFAVVAGKTDGEDKVGRAKMELQEPAELVHRAFEIAQAFVSQAQGRGCIREAEPAEQRAVKFGLLEKLKHENSSYGGDNPATSIEEIRERIAKRRLENNDGAVLDTEKRKSA